ncbi:MAG: hypothetical protein P8Y77_07420 [Nitrospirota bacterium]
MQFPIKFPLSSAPVTALFLEKEPTRNEVEGKIDLILSPSLYWFRQESLPAKTVFQARKLAPSVFDAILPKGHYSYHVLKREGSFWLFAYREEQISETIRKAGIRPTDIRHVYFAQTECATLETPLQLNGGKVLSNVDGVVTELPSKYAAGAEDAQRFFVAHERKGPPVGIALYPSALLDKKQFKRLTAVSALFFVLYAVEYVMAQQHLDAVLAEKEKIMKTYRIPQTSFERDGLIRALEKKQQRQVRLREKAKALFALPADADVHAERLTLTARKVTMSIAFKRAQQMVSFKNKLKTIGTVTSENLKGNTLFVEAEYE